MAITEIQAKSLLRKHQRIDSWFVTRCGMNIYRGCAHNCVYCDGRAEGYYVPGEFGCDVGVKVNAPNILDNELNPARKRKPWKPSYILLGGGVGDSYQPIEEQYKITRQVLEIIEKWGHPVHVLTKSCLVERDFDILSRIKKKANVIVSMSLSSANDDLSRQLEPGASPASARLATLKRAKGLGFNTGVFLMPVVPFITDTLEMLDHSVRSAKETGVDFVLHGGMTLKDGRQKDHMMGFVEHYNPDLVPHYEAIYHGDKWGSPSHDYHASLALAHSMVAKHYQMPRRIPPRLYKDVLDDNDRSVVVLESLDYLLRQGGNNSNYRAAANAIAKLDEPLMNLRGKLKSIHGVGSTTERIIREVLDTGTSSYLEKFL